jgi:hypothetical protein
MCYAAIYEVWRSMLNPMTVETLHQNILADFSRPVGALGIFVQDAGSATGVLKLVHGVHSFPGAPGQTRYRMTTLAFEGDVSGIDICTVAFEPKQLEIMVDANVPGSMERVMQLLNDEPGRETLGPFAATDANVRTTTTRGMAYFPFEFMEPLLGADLTARQVFVLIVPALIDMGIQYTCASLIEFLTVALVQPTTDVETPLTVHDQAGKASHSPGPMAINHRREHVLYRDLPALRPPPCFLQPVTQPSSMWQRACAILWLRHEPTGTIGRIIGMRATDPKRRGTRWVIASPTGFSFCAEPPVMRTCRLYTTSGRLGPGASPRDMCCSRLSKPLVRP